MQILIVEDEVHIRSSIAEMLADEGYTVLEAGSVEEGIRIVDQEAPSVVLSDINLPDGDGFRILHYCKSQGHPCSVLFMTAFGNRELAIQAITEGADDYISKPIRFDELFARLHRIKEMQNLRGQVQRKVARKVAESELSILGDSRPMQLVRRIAEKASESHAPLLITGETGTGKGLLAKLIHTSSTRKEHPLISINCASIPENLLESELFGYRKGAFTGADRNKQGLLEEVGDGTLFLDEIGEMPSALQAKLLHVLDDGAFRPLGGMKSQRFKGRVIAATNVDLEEKIGQKEFREDLYYRLSVLTIEMPPLRHRIEDIIILAERIYAVLAEEMGCSETRLPFNMVDQLQSQPWPGNVRQLRNYLERMLILDGDTDVTLASPNLAEALHRFEKSFIERTIAECSDDKQKAADQLEIGLSTLYRKLEA
ncbi:response regulator NasT [Mariprofundus micogutta]|uniref:Response regulator NasT n=1 Tax=Mariprofundus micogutta TaxID=1921010 RepID=A0A1L8CNX0_9PROT|nr:sigma-54 dependent transcriptional regulator [Mariprofundus micogutta]GAV20622.1 response regulator NasT [Mariprofundus micogutta]